MYVPIQGNYNFIQRYSSAFAFGLIENGFERGDKLLLWVDQTNSAEILVAQVSNNNLSQSGILDGSIQSWCLNCYFQREGEH